MSAGAYAGEVAARIERLPVTSYQIKTRVIVGTATFFDAFDALAIAYILPVIAPLWNLRAQDVGFLISAGFLGQLIGAIAFGWVAERYGRITSLVWSIAIFAILSAACALAWDYRSLLVLRFLQGFGLGGEVPVAATYIGELSKARARGRFVLLFELVFPLGIVTASLLGLWLVPNFGWQSMFLVGAIPGLLVLVLQRLLPELPRWLASRGRDAEAEAALRIIEDATQRASREPLPELRVTAAPTPPSWSDLFGPLYLRRTLVVWAIWFATYFVNYGLTTWLPTLYRTVYHLPLQTSLAWQLYTNLITICASFTCAMLIDLTGRRLWFVFAFLGSAAALLTLWYIGPFTPERVWWCGTLSGMCVATLSLAVYLYTPELYPTRRRALAVGTATAWLRLAAIIGPFVVAATVQGPGLKWLFLIFGLVALAAAIVVWFFAIETKGRVLEEISP